MLSVQLPAGATKERTDATLAQINQLANLYLRLRTLLPFPASVFRLRQNMALGFVILKDWSERTAPGSDATSISGKLDRYDDGYAERRVSVWRLCLQPLWIGYRFRLDDLPTRP